MKAVTKLKVVAPSTPETRSMPFKEWAAIKNFFHQRNHERLAKTNNAVKKFKKFLQTHQSVAAVRMMGTGQIFKIDGHTRTQAWLDGVGTPPANMLVTIYDVETREEAIELYESIDSKRATKTSADELFATMRDAGFCPKSSLLNKGGISTALNIVLGQASFGFRKRDQIKAVMNEVKVLDSITPELKMFPQSVAAAAILSIMRDGHDALPFWIAYNEQSVGCTNNAHTELRKFVSITRPYSATGVYGRDAYAGRVLAIYDQWKNNPFVMIDFNEVVTAIDGQRYLQLFKKGIPA